MEGGLPFNQPKSLQRCQEGDTAPNKYARLTPLCQVSAAGLALINAAVTETCQCG